MNVQQLFSNSKNKNEKISLSILSKTSSISSAIAIYKQHKTEISFSKFHESILIIQNLSLVYVK